MDYEYNGKNGQATRLEMLIALDYLLNNCTSEKKTSVTLKLVEYAREHYNTFIDRRRANGIFDDLVDISNKHPELLPFLIKKVPNKPRYYIEKRLWGDEDVIKIANSIQGKKMPKSASKALLEKFLAVAFTDEQRQKHFKKLKVSDRGNLSTVSIQTMKINEFLENLRDGVMRFHFTLAPTVRRDNASGFFPRRGVLGGYVYDTIPGDDETRVCLYLDEYKVALVVKIEELIIDTTFEPVPRSNKNSLTYELKGKVTNIDEWLSGYFSGQSGYTINIEFKFLAQHLTAVKKAYRQYFKREMKYTIQQREEILPVIEQDNTETPRTILVDDAYASVETSYNAFKKWYLDNGFFQYMVILNPAIFNDRLVGALLERFARRLNKYGERFDYEITKTMKPEYAEKLRQREERIERFRREHPEPEDDTK